MSDFDFEAELAMMRGNDKPKKQTQQAAPVKTGRPKPVRQGNDATKKAPTQGNAGTAKTKPVTQAPKAPPPTPPVEEIPPVVEAPPVVEEGFRVKQSHQETNASDPVPHTIIDYKRFKELPGIFHRVGGERPVVMASDIHKSSVGGVPSALLKHIQETYRTRYVGATIDFPWGIYTVTHDNKVFTQNASLVRYLGFEALRDADGLSVQYAKQWFLGHHPLGFEKAFDAVTAMRTGDELDIYALAIVASSDVARPVEIDRFDALDQRLETMMQQMQTHEANRKKHADQQSTIETILLLDRMGLLTGGLPKDIGAFVRVLEVNRSLIGTSLEQIDAHNEAEERRKVRLALEQRKKDFNMRK